MLVLHAVCFDVVELRRGGISHLSGPACLRTLSAMLKYDWTITDRFSTAVGCFVTDILRFSQPCGCRVCRYVTLCGLVPPYQCIFHIVGDPGLWSN